MSVHKKTNFFDLLQEMQEVPKDKNMYTLSGSPDFKGLNVFVLPGAFQSDVMDIFTKVGFGLVKTVDEADVVCFTGGVDIDPSLYGEEPIPETQMVNTARDIYEVDIYAKALEQEKVMVGICRGAQFLHAMNGGRLWQHVEGHGREHDVYDIDDMTYVTVSSMHHQMLRYDEKIGMELIAVGDEQVSRVFKGQHMAVTLSGATNTRELEVEAASYVATKCIVFQGHPEVGPSPYTEWFFGKVADFIDELEGDVAKALDAEAFRDMELDDPEAPADEVDEQEMVEQTILPTIN